MAKRLICILAMFFSFAVFAQSAKNADAPAADSKDKYGEKTFAGLTLREIGPAPASGRIIRRGVEPKDGRVWYIATAGGGVWKTTNAGTSFAPVFDDQKS